MFKLTKSTIGKTITIKHGVTHVNDKPIVHFKPFNNNLNVQCLSGSAHDIRSSDKSKVTCPICLGGEQGKNYWFEFEQKHGNVHKNF